MAPLATTCQSAETPETPYQAKPVLDLRAYEHIVKEGLFSPILTPLQLVFNSPRLAAKYLIWRKSDYVVEVRDGEPVFVEGNPVPNYSHVLVSLHQTNQRTH